LGVVANIKGKKSNKILKQALTVLRNLDHRGGQGADNNSGDGAGVLMQIPHLFFIKEALKQGLRLPHSGSTPSACFFLPPDEVERENLQRHLKRLSEKTIWT
jgi:glutamate synthase (ferredoxin)